MPIMTGQHLTDVLEIIDNASKEDRGSTKFDEVS